MNDSYVLINLLITLLHTADRTEDEYATKHDQWWVSTRPNTADVHTLRTALNMFPSWYLVLQTLIVFLDADRLLITLLLAHCTAECRNKQGITAGEEQTHRRTALRMYFHASVAHLPLAIAFPALLQTPVSEMFSPKNSCCCLNTDERFLCADQPAYHTTAYCRSY